MADINITPLVEKWEIANLTNFDFGLPDVPGLTAANALPKKVGGIPQWFNALDYTTAETLRDSDTFRNGVINGTIGNKGYQHTHQGLYDAQRAGGTVPDASEWHSHNGLDVLTGGTSSDADDLHTHNSFISEEESISLVESAIKNIDLTVYTRSDGSINQLSDIVSDGATIESAISQAHAEDHTLLEHINDDGPFTIDNFKKLFDGSNADLLHTHDISGLTITHNELDGLNDGDYKHLTTTEYIDFTTLTDGSNADLLHTHDISGLTVSHNELSGLQGGNSSIDEFYHISANDVINIGTLTGQENADTLHYHDASNIVTDITDFDGALTSSENTSQKAFDKLDDIVGLLVPSQPTSFPSSALSISSVGNSPKIANGAIPDNTNGGSLGSAGDSVTRVTSSTVSTNIIQDSGPGNTGTVTAVINNSADGSKALTTGDDSGTYTSLIISDNVDYPSETPGFWQSFDVQISKIGVNTGWNRFKITHDAAGNTSDVYFIRDSLTSTPVVSGGVVTQNIIGTVDYSSSIPHYNTGAILNLNSVVMTNICGETYYDGSDVFSILSTNSIFSTNNKTLSNIGISTPVNRQTIVATALSNQTVSIDGSNVHNMGQVRYRGKNVNGTGSIVTVSSPIILVMRGSSGSRIDENDIPVSGLGTSPVSTNAGRIDMGDGETPNESFTATTTDWVSSAALDSHDAAVVGGELTHDTTDYSSGYLPVGVDLSSQNASQYITIWFRRDAVSKFDIQITGQVSGCWIKLPGVSDALSSENGWWNMTIPYAGSGKPGDIGDGNGSNGVALAGSIPIGSSISDERYTCTFGIESSSNSTNNNILVRFKLVSGDFVSALSFKEASN
jgi:hypothetical protein